jgi:nitrite reductase (NO-forming)/hydroxylamine reductase
MEPGGAGVKILALALIVGLAVGVGIGYTIKSVTLEEAEPPVAETEKTAPQAGEAVEGAEPAKEVRVKMRAYQFGFDPEVIEVEVGTRVIIEIVEVSAEKEPNFRFHTFTLNEFGINQMLEVGKTYTIEFVADKVGTFTFECAIYCGVGHAGMKGTLIVKPREGEEVREIDFTDIEDVKSTLKVLVPEDSLPDSPQKWSLEDYNYLMVVVQREYEGGAVKIINTRTLEDLGDIVGVGARVHVVEPNHVDKRWIYTISRDEIVSKIDLYSMQIVRQIKVGTDSRGLAISEDGKYLAVGNYAPNTMVILDAYTLEPLKIIKVYGVNLDGEPVESRVAGLMYARGYFVFSAKELGEVWIASGQSNMEWALSATEDGDARMRAAHHPGLRIFNMRS